MFLVFFHITEKNDNDNLFLTTETILFLMEYKQSLFYTIFFMWQYDIIYCHSTETESEEILMCLQ